MDSNNTDKEMFPSVGGRGVCIMYINKKSFFVVVVWGYFCEKCVIENHFIIFGYIVTNWWQLW